MVKRIIIVLMFMSAGSAIWAVDLDEDNSAVIIKTDVYELHWKKAAQMGYIQCFVGGSQDTIIGSAGRAFYHSSDYGGWKDWGALQDWEIVEDKGNKVTIQYQSHDAGNKQYTCLATYWDGAPYIKHEVTVTADGAAVTSFQSGHEPMFEINRDVAGMEVFTDPFPHVVYWTDEGFFGALYGPDAQEARKHDWGGRSPGRMDLVHDNQGANLKDGQSATIVYYVAFGKGDKTTGNDLADEVQKEPESQAVSPEGMLTTIWGAIKSPR